MAEAVETVAFTRRDLEEIRSAVKGMIEARKLVAASEGRLLAAVERAMIWSNSSAPVDKPNNSRVE